MLCVFQVWISYGQFELSVGGPENVAQARDVYRRANQTFKQADEKEERLVLLESWKEFEVQSTHHLIYAFKNGVYFRLCYVLNIC